MICRINPNPAPKPAGTNVGAIAGGVAGGVGAVCIVVFLVWLFWIKKRRAQQDKEFEEEWEHDEIAYQKRMTQFRAMQQDAASTRTRGSLANSILSRASNFIQIAYIPGVTNRNGYSARNSIYAPVPPVPAAYRQERSQPKSPLSNDGDALFFGIDDLRGSTYTGTSANRDTRYTGNRDTRYTVDSITPSLARDSVASDVQWDDATTAPMPASSLTVATPRMVSVKSSSGSSKSPTPDSGSNPGTPPEHLVDQVAKDVPVMVAGQGPSPNSSVRAKAKQVTVGKSKEKGRFPVRQTSDASSTAPSKSHVPIIPSPLAEQDSDSESSDEHADATQSLIGNIHRATSPAPASSIHPTESPFFDASDLPSAAITAAASTRPNPYASMASSIGAAVHKRAPSRRGGSKGKINPLSAVIEEATKRASAESRNKEEDPFGDEHEIEK